MRHPQARVGIEIDLDRLALTRTEDCQPGRPRSPPGSSALRWIPTYPNFKSATRIGRTYFVAAVLAPESNNSFKASAPPSRISCT